MTMENTPGAADGVERTPARRDAIDINDFVYGATGARVRRLTMPDGKHWFPAVDVCGQLGYTTPHKALRDHVPEKMRDFLETVTGSHGLSVPAGREWRRDLQVIDLRGLIHLVNGCTKLSCRPFKEWVVDVIVAVQRDGSYCLDSPRPANSEPAVTAPVIHALPAQVADAIVRLEERNLKLDEQFAAAQHETLLAQRATARALERIADRLDTLFADGSALVPPATVVPAQPVRPTAEAVLDDWRSRMSLTEDVWAVAVTMAPVLAAEGEWSQPLESIADRTGLTVQRVNECLRFMRKHACIRSRGGTVDGAPVYVLNHP
ncbi:Bro-N domain-containing protein [Streptomyces sp. NPDC001832]|uniref:BRO-N domain-containing protein n=1 Tax=Streptomyces sp. NPDC001832 TaxID=3154527 RepID=UPI00332A0FA2